ncbi:MAG: hypothetical protein PWQ12_497 [Clostridiales bacterium]|jgi:hypothetical protein|nr:hypothetical protein [Clostridiales bacterium]
MKYKGIVHNILNDAPFIGAVVIANRCSMPCEDCINESLKSDVYTMEDSAEEIVETIQANGLNQGVILSGLEWTEQPEDLTNLVTAALNQHLEVMVYTHHSEKRFFEIVPGLIGKKIYVKFGLYDSNLRSDNHFSYDVKLATTNQYIKKF